MRNLAYYKFIYGAVECCNYANYSNHIFRTSALNGKLYRGEKKQQAQHPRIPTGHQVETENTTLCLHAGGMKPGGEEWQMLLL